MHLLSAGELIKNVEDSGEDAQPCRALYDKAIAEARSGASVRMAMVITVGQKPIT